MVINFTGKDILAKRQHKYGNGGEHANTVSINPFILKFSSISSPFKYQYMMLKHNFQFWI